MENIVRLRRDVTEDATVRNAMRRSPCGEMDGERGALSQERSADGRGRGVTEQGLAQSVGPNVRLASTSP